MATSVLQFGYTSGQTLQCKLLTLGGEAFLFATSAVSEVPSSSGQYKATFTEMSALNGTYRAVVTLSGTGVASFEAKWTGVDAQVAQASEFVNVDLPSGGDATLANQTAILGKLASAPIEVVTPVTSATTLVLVNKDNYSANNGRLLTFPVEVDYSSASSVKLLFSINDSVIKQTAAVVASATSITVDLEVDFGSSLSFSQCSGAVCDLVATCSFALVASYGVDEESIARGVAYIYDRAAV
tara:strand:+ start:453 stop:1175 length:723 start_codon:yes stop_codon:yes gene_type:complete